MCRRRSGIVLPLLHLWCGYWHDVDSKMRTEIKKVLDGQAGFVRQGTIGGGVSPGGGGKSPLGGSGKGKGGKDSNASPAGRRMSKQKTHTPSQ